MTVSHEYKFNRDICNVSMPPAPNNTTCRALKVWLLRDLQNAFFTLGLNVDGKLLLFNNTFNGCRFKRQLGTNVYLKNFVEEILKNINFALQCPFKKGYYEVKEHAFKPEGYGNHPGFVNVQSVLNYDYTFKAQIDGKRLDFIAAKGQWMIKTDSSE